MTDAVKRLMDLADDYADRAEAKGKGNPTYAEARQALQDELTRLFTPLSEAAVWHEGSASYYQAKLIRKISPEEAHGIGGES